MERIIVAALSGDVTCTNAGVVTIADNAITAKLAGGTDGTIITFDANGDPVAVGPGTDGQGFNKHRGGFATV